MNKTSRLLLAVLLAWAVTGCDENPAVKTPIKIGIDIAYAFITQEKGFFKKNGVEVELVLKKNTIESSNLFANNEVHGMFGLFSDMIMLNASGIPAKTVYIVDHSVTGDAIIARPDIRSRKDLKGKLVSFDGVNTVSHIFVLKALERAGLNESDVRFKNVNGVDVPKALKNKEIDAGRTWEPLKTGALKKGFKTPAESQDVLGVIIDCLMFSPKVIHQSPEDVIGIVKALVEAKEFLYLNRDEGIAIMAKALGMPKDDVATGIQGAFHYGLEENLKIHRKTENASPLYAGFKLITGFYMQRGQISQIPAFETLFEPKFVMQLNKEKKGK